MSDDDESGRDVAPLEAAIEDATTGAFAKRVTNIQLRSYRGPLPPPEQLAAYEQVSPGAADRIISMAEREQTSRHASDRRVEYRKWFERAIILAIGLAALAVSAFALYEDRPFAGLAGIVVAVGGIAGAWAHVERRRNDAELLSATVLHDESS